MFILHLFCLFYIYFVYFTLILFILYISYSFIICYVYFTSFFSLHHRFINHFIHLFFQRACRTRSYRRSSRRVGKERRLGQIVGSSCQRKNGSVYSSEICSHACGRGTNNVLVSCFVYFCFLVILSLLSRLVVY